MIALTVSRLGHLGDGIADTPDGPVIVPGALPGETVEGVLNDGRLEAPRILTPVPERVRPPCPHARTCGGCTVQHAADDLIARWKQRLVQDALRAQGIAAEVGLPVTSPAASRRRAGFAARRTKAGAMVGFHGRGSHTLVDTPGCLVVTEAIRGLLPDLGRIAELGASRKTEIGLQVTQTASGFDLAVTGAKPLDTGLSQALARIGAEAGLARLSWEEEIAAQWAVPELAMGPYRVPLPPGAFLQATAAGEAALVERVRGFLDGAGRVADLFCGLGTFALPLAERAEVLAVEGDPALTRALEAGWRRASGLKRIETRTRDLFRNPLLPEELKGIEAVVIDPPRAGAAAQTGALARSGVAVIAAVSCNPATFARDAATLIAAGFEMGPVTVVDQFRWSPHVELVAGFRRP